MNNFVDINFDSETTTIICTFLNQPMDTTKECSFNVTYGPDCGQLLGLYTSMGTGDSVSSPELPLIEDISEYCFTVTARSNNVTVSVEGTLNLFEVSNVIGKTITDSVRKIIITSIQQFRCCNCCSSCTSGNCFSVCGGGSGDDCSILSVQTIAYCHKIFES